MREIALTVGAEHAEDVLDRLLLLVAGGVHEVARGDEVELRVRGMDGALPGVERLTAAAGPWLRGVAEREVPDDWRARRAADFVPLVVAGRLAVRPAWAPPAGDLPEVVLPEGADAFGAGTHPTTRLVLELLAGRMAGGRFADLGCGTGILAVAAARLGWHPVVAVDAAPAALAATRAAAALNGVAVEVVAADLTAPGAVAAVGGAALRGDAAPAGAGEPGPATAAANVPPDVHAALAASLAEPPDTLLASGFTADGEAVALEGWRARGMVERERREASGWRAVVLVRP